MSAGLQAETAAAAGRLCWRCAAEPAAAVLDGLVVLGWSCIELQLDDWYAQAFQAGHGDRSLDSEMRAEERPARLPQLRMPAVTVEVCPICKRSEHAAYWMSVNGWPGFCRTCRWER